MSSVTNPPDSRMEEYIDEEEIDLREYWRTIKKHRRSIIGIALLAGVFSTLISLAMDPVYRSTATVMIEVNENKVAPIEEVYGFNPANREYLKTQFEILKSRKLIEVVINRLALEKHPEYNPEQSESLLKRLGLTDMFSEASESGSKLELYEAIVESFTGHLSISPVRNTQLVKVNFEAKGPKLARDVANTLAQVFIESGLEARVELTQQASKWLSSRLEQLRKKLTESESELKAYVATQPTGRFEALPEVVNHPVIQRIKEETAEAQRKISELSERYGPEHPKMIAARSDMKVTKRNLQREMRKVTGALTADYAGATNARQLERSKNRELDLTSTFQKDSKLHTLQREMIADRQLYTLFLERIKETNLIGDIHNASARVVDPAVLPIKPVKPKKRLIVGLSIMLALFVGVMIAFLLEYLDNTLKTNVDVEEKLGLTTLGILPKLKTHAVGDEAPVPESMFVDKPHSHFAEAIRTIRTGVMLSGLDDPHKIVLVTSSLPGEGKTTVSMNLAYALAHLEGKVLLIDADMRKPTVGIKVGLSERVAGLSDLTAGTTAPKNCIHTSKYEGLDILPAGIIPPNPQELLSTKRFEELLAKLSEHYNRIVIDTAPTIEVADALILSKQSSAVVYVTMADETPYQLAQSGIRRLQHVGASIIGVVLNQLDYEKVGKWDSYGAYSGYYGGYGYGGKEVYGAKLKQTA